MGAGTPSGSEYRAASAWMGDPTEKRTLFLVGSSLPSEPGGGRSVAPTGCPADGLLGMTAALGSQRVAVSVVPTNAAGAGADGGGGVTAVLGGIAPLSGEQQGDELQNKVNLLRNSQ